MRDVKVIGGKDCVSQHKLLVGDIELNTSFSKSRIPPKQKLWKMSNPEVRKTGKSSRRVEIKKSIFKQKGRQSQLYTLQGQSTRRQIW